MLNWLLSPGPIWSPSPISTAPNTSAAFVNITPAEGENLPGQRWPVGPAGTARGKKQAGWLIVRQNQPQLSLVLLMTSIFPRQPDPRSQIPTKVTLEKAPGHGARLHGPQR
ncbi:unnamed protein product [Gadus morhua 'NCC']